jgi:hypothetical protein
MFRAMGTRLTELPALEPDPLEPQPESVARYVEALQGLSKANADYARRAAWSQIRLAGARAGRRPAEAHETLDRLFRLGSPPRPALDGPTRGLMVTPTVPRPLDLGLRALASAWMPWTGKRFDAAANGGENLLAPSARWPTRILWPSYRPEPLGRGLAAFRFRTYVSPGTVDPDIETLKIDYDSSENPTLLIRDVLDEVVQVVRGAYLGKVLLRRGTQWRLVGYFGLQPGLAVAGEQVVAAPPEAAAAAA